MSPSKSTWCSGYIGELSLNKDVESSMMIWASTMGYSWCMVLIKNKTRNLKFQIKYMFWVLYFIRKNYNLEDILAGTLNITRNAKKLRENKVRGILQILAKQHGVKVSAKIYSFEMVEKKLSFCTKWDSPLHLTLILKLDQRMVRKTQQLPEEELGVGSNNKN